jgi:hypothetical protein
MSTSATVTSGTGVPGWTGGMGGETTSTSPAGETPKKIVAPKGTK